MQVRAVWVEANSPLQLWISLLLCFAPYEVRLSPHDAIKDLRHPSRCHAEIDFQITGRRTEKRGDYEAQKKPYLLTWWPLHNTHFRLLVKKSMAEFLSNDLESDENRCFLTEHSPVYLCLYQRLCALPVVWGTSLSYRSGKVCPVCCWLRAALEGCV